MKRYFVFVLVFAAAAWIFSPDVQAQFNWSLYTDFNIGLLAWNTPTGENADKFITVNNVIKPNAPANNPSANRGNYSYNAGGMDFFSYGSGNWLRHNALRMTIDFQGELIGFHTRTLLDELVRPDLIPTIGAQHSTTGNHSLVQGEGRTVNWGDFLRYSFDEWYVKGNYLNFSAYVGNTDDRGKVNGFNTFTDDTLQTILIEHYGVNTPDSNADFSGAGRDINNFMSRPSTDPANDDPYNWIMPYFMLGARLGASIGKLKFPVSFQIAADPGNNSGIASSSNYRKYNGSIRVSAERIARAVTFDAIYRFRGGHPRDIDSYDPVHNPTGILQPDGSGFTSHSFGLYANVLNVPKLGMGLGYSGYIMTYQDDKNTNKATTKETITKNGPLYSGIDLRLQYTGLEKITITSINNISFASAVPSKNNAISMGVLGANLDNYTADAWLALYNALGFDFAFSDRFSASVQVANRYGLITTGTSIANGTATIKRSRLQLGGGGYAAFQINRFLLVQGGFAFRHINDAYSNTDPVSQNSALTRNASGGAFEIAIPVRINIIFEKR